MDPVTQVLIGLTAALNTASLLAKVISEFQQTGRVPSRAEIEVATQAAMAAHDNLNDALNGEPPAPSPDPA